MKKGWLGLLVGARGTLAWVPCIGLGRTRAVRTFHTVPRSHDVAVAAAVSMAVAVAVVVMAAGSTVVAVDGSAVVVTAIDDLCRRAYRHASHALHDDRLCRCNDFSFPHVDLPGWPA